MSTVQGGPKVVALTVDDGTSPMYTPQILRILRRYGVTAAFSMIHTWNHDNLGYMPAAAVWDEIARATDAIRTATGERPSTFRAPYGHAMVAIGRAGDRPRFTRPRRTPR